MEKSLSPLFAGISAESKAAMKTCFGAREQRFRAGEAVYDFAARRNIIGIVASGSAVMERIDRQGGRTILEHFEPGGVFGEMLMFENVAGDSLRVVAEVSCCVWFIDAVHVTHQCENACAHHTRLVENMLRLMAGKATALSERVEVLSRRSIRDKLLCYFSLLSAKSGAQGFSLPFSLSALADYISADRSAMMRELKKMRDERLVAVNGRTVTLYSRL